MKYLTYGHRHGDLEVSEKLRAEISAALTACEAKVAKGRATTIRDDILRKLTQKGWSPEVEIDPASKISVTSIKEHVGLCFQTGNMSRMYADLMKLQTIYLRGTIKAGIMIVAALDAARELGDNIANFDRLTRELPIFDRVISVPLWIIGIDD